MDYIGVCAIIENSDKKILVENHKKLAGLSLPGGKCERGEDPKYAIIRELKEELGITVTDLTLIDIKMYKDIPYPKITGETANFNEYLFEINSFTGEITNKEPMKHPELLWLSKEELEDREDNTIILNDYIKRIL